MERICAQQKNENTTSQNEGYFSYPIVAIVECLML